MSNIFNNQEFSNGKGGFAKRSRNGAMARNTQLQNSSGQSKIIRGSYMCVHINMVKNFGFFVRKYTKINIYSPFLLMRDIN